MSRNRILRDKLQGFAVEYYVANVLTRNGCLVRTVPEDSTTGFSLLCETDENSRGKREPFQHFWVHVRTGDRVSLIEPGKQASCLFKAKELLYWARQPIPVYAFLIPEYSSASLPDTIYIVDLSGHLTDLQIPMDKDRLTLRSNRLIHPESEEDCRRFLSSIAIESEVPTFTSDVVEEIALPKPAQ
ncbi:MAG: hypothetical protein KAW17_12550 [Candidatus Eisenbacteria sp.]|nr:hypothetical protein [Candidatus Eisenbacteria bacterium]